MTYAGLLTDACSVVRRTPGAFNPTTGAIGAPTDTSIYAGPCKVDSFAAASRARGRTRVGEEAVIQGDYVVFLQTSADDVETEDVVIVTASEDGHMVGRELIVKKNDASYSPNTANAMRALLCDDVQEGP